MQKAFISYSMHTEDEETARAIANFLKKSQFDTWIAADDLEPGENWITAIQREIPLRDTFILLWSKNATASDWIEDEWQLAWNRRKTIIPVRLDETELPEFLKLRQAIECDILPRNKMYSKLLETLTAQRTPIALPSVASQIQHSFSKLGQEKLHHYLQGEPISPKFIKVETGEFYSSLLKETVYVEAFEIADFPITIQEFRQYAPHNLNEAAKDDEFPVNNVSWDAATKVCNWLSEKTGWKVKLPSELQWEYVAKGGKNYEYATENGKFGLDLLNYGKMQEGVTERAVYRPNPFRIHDMSGNVWEWCTDESEFSADYRIVRGGSWFDIPDLCKTTSRYHFHRSYGNIFTGFRPIREIS